MTQRENEWTCSVCELVAKIGRACDGESQYDTFCALLQLLCLVIENSPSPQHTSDAACAVIAREAGEAAVLPEYWN
jgi:hypothetical protein